MLEFEKQRRDIAWYTDVAVAGSVVPFSAHASKYIACHVVFDAMEFLEDIEEVGKVFYAHIFYAKVVDNETELDGSLFVAPETEC